MSSENGSDVRSADAVIRRLCDALGVSTDSALANLMGVKRHTVSGWRSRNSIPFRDIVDIAEREGLNLQYVLAASGPVRRPDHWAPAEITTKEVEFLGESGSANDPVEEFVLVPVYGVELAAGAGRIPEDERVVRYHAYHQFYFRKWGLDSKQCCVVRISGDSMNDLLFDGDHGLVHMAERNVISGKAYAFRMGEELLVKYLQRLPNGNLQASSHNHAQYPPFEISKSDLGSDVEIIGRLRDHNHRWD